jgi:beta-glucuronidase
MGFLTWIEPNIYCSKPTEDMVNTVFSMPDFVDAAVSMTKEMIRAARRYASVVIWGIGNECNVFHPEARAFFETVVKTVREEDTTRLIGYASLYGQVGCMADLVDVMGINSYFGWYGTIREFEVRDEREKIDGGIRRREPDLHGLSETIERVAGEIGADTVLLLTEFGADSIPGYYSSAQELWSEEYHAAVIRAYVSEVREHAVGGTFVFAYTDYSDPSKPMNGRWNGYNLKGMVSYNREIKLPYYALKEAYEKIK